MDTKSEEVSIYVDLMSSFCKTGVDETCVGSNVGSSVGSKSGDKVGFTVRSIVGSSEDINDASSFGSSVGS